MSPPEFTVFWWVSGGDMGRERTGHALGRRILHIFNLQTKRNIAGGSHRKKNSILPLESSVDDVPMSIAGIVWHDRMHASEHVCARVRMCVRVCARVFIRASRSAC